MGSITATALRQDLYRTIDRVNENSEPVVITTSKGKGAVLVGEDDWAAIEETLYIMSMPGMVESLQEGMAEDVSECVAEDELGW